MKQIFFLVLLLIIMTFAFSDIGTTRFTVDQDSHFLRISQIITGEGNVLIGTTNSWVNLGPLENYLFLPLQYFFPSPEFSAYFGTLLFLLTLILFYLLCRTIHLSKELSFLLALLPAMDPYLLWLARDCTHLTLFFPTSLIFWLGICWHINSYSKYSSTIAVTGFLLGLQVHLVTLVYLPVILLVLLMHPPTKEEKPLLLLPLLLFILLYTPLVIHEFSTGFSDILFRIELINQPVSNTSKTTAENFFAFGDHLPSMLFAENKEILKRLPFLSYRTPLLSTTLLVSLVFILLSPLFVSRKVIQSQLTIMISLTYLALLLPATIPGPAIRYYLPAYPLYYLSIAAGCSVLFLLMNKKNVMVKRTTHFLTLLLLTIIFFQGNWLLVQRTICRESGFVAGDLTLNSKQKVIKSLVNTNKFDQWDFTHNFHNLINGENGGYQYLASQIAPKGSGGIQSAFLGSTTSTHQDQREIIPNVSIMLLTTAVSNQIQLALHPLNKENFVFQQGTLPIFLECQGQSFSLETTITSEEQPLILGIKSRAILEKLVIDGKPYGEYSINKKIILRESLPHVTFCKLPLLKTGPHRLHLQLYLKDLWTDLSLFALPPTIKAGQLLNISQKTGDLLLHTPSITPSLLENKTTPQ